MSEDKLENPYHPKNNAKCLHCGDEGSCQIDITWRYIQCKAEDCGATGPERETVAEAWAAWNRRHVCDDKNGDKVYAGDRAKAADCKGKVDRLGGICIESEDGHLYHVWPSEIELIKETGK